MTTPPESNGVVFSQKLFQRLLKAYPKRHREEYGAAMAQLFHDQCRDAWREAGGWGLVKLWLRVLPDVVKTSVSEHFANLKEKGINVKNLALMLRANSSPWAVFAMIFVLVFVTVLGTSTVVTLLLPKIYSSTTRIKLESEFEDVNSAGRSPTGAEAIARLDPAVVQTEIETMKSELVLDRVIEKLDLNRVWAKKFGMRDNLRTSETRGMLIKVIELRTVRNTALIEISAYSEEPQEAAALANGVAGAYQKYELANLHERIAAEAVRTGVVPLGWHMRVAIVDSAEPAQRALRPNIPLNLFLGGVAGMLAALVTGAAAVCIVVVLKRRMVAQPR